MNLESQTNPPTKILFLGRSHLTCIEEGFDSAGFDGAADCKFLYLHEFARKAGGGPPEPMQRRQGLRTVDNYHLDQIRSIVAGQQPEILCLSIHGNEHFATSLVDLGLSVEEIRAKVEKKVQLLSLPWLKFVSKLHPRVLLIPPPPPVEAAHILAHPGKMRDKIAGQAVSPGPVRVDAWKHQLQLLKAEADRVGIEFLEYPSAVFSGSGLLKPEFASDDPTHGNEKFGALVISLVLEKCGRAEFRTAQAQAAAAPTAASKAHPYKGLPDAAFWRESVASVAADRLDPVREVPFAIGKTNKVATAGSCFAQHISKHLRKGGFDFLVTERPTDAGGGDAEARGFYDFSARYGNVYTSRQLVQLFDRAFGFFTPLEDHWVLHDGRVCDPFRPRIEPDGFTGVEALRDDRRRHLAAVRRMFEELDIFVFTLGLTECWISKLDGAAYPIAPGVSGGQFDPARHAFVNLTVDDIRRDLQDFIHKLRLVNPKARLILTVSPVPLAATFSEEHVLVATTYSKSVLRVAAEMVERANEGVMYFPSYEIITGAYARGKYFAEDLRTVTDAGVSHVMQVFMSRMTGSPSTQTAPAVDAALADIDDLAEAVCDEALLARR